MTKLEELAGAFQEAWRDKENLARQIEELEAERDRIEARISDLSGRLFETSGPTPDAKAHAARRALLDYLKETAKQDVPA